MDRFRAARDGAMAPEAALLAAGFTRSRLRDLVLEDALRRGICGYWIPEAPDPGALRVMCSAIAGEMPEEDE